jgi:hypothetical protein
LTDLTAALARLGWDERRTAELAELGHDPSAAARVVRVDRERFEAWQRGRTRSRGVRAARRPGGAECRATPAPLDEPLAARGA